MSNQEINSTSSSSSSSSSIFKSLDSSKIWVICPKCRNFSEINLYVKSDNFYIRFNCPCTVEDNFYKIKEYLQLMEEKKKIRKNCDMNPNHSCYYAVNYCFDCDKFICELCRQLHNKMHKEHIISDEEIHVDVTCYRHLENNKIIAYCEDCKKNLCIECLKAHDPYHTIHDDIKKIFSKEIALKTYEEFNKTKKEYIESLESSKNELEALINNKSDFRDIKNKFKKSYEANIKINNDIILIIQTLYQNYLDTIDDTPNFNIINNIRKYSNFKSNKFIYDKNNLDDNKINEILNNFINFCNTKYIFKNKETPLEIHKIIKFPTDKISASNILCPINEHIILEGDWNGQVNLIDINNEKCLKTFIGHFSGISALCYLKNGYIISGGTDCSMNLYDPSINIDDFQGLEEAEDGTLYFKGFLSGHSDYITKIIQIKNGNIMTCSWDKKINLYSGEMEEIKEEKKEEKEAADNLNNVDKNLSNALNKLESKEGGTPKNSNNKGKDEKSAKQAKEKNSKKSAKDLKLKEGKDSLKMIDKDNLNNNLENLNNNNNEASNTQIVAKTEEELKKEAELNKKKEILNKRYTFNLIKSFTSHKDKVNDIIELKNGNIISCSNDKSIKFYNMKTLKEFKSINIEDGLPLKLSQISDNKLAVAIFNPKTRKNTLRIYEITTNELNREDINLKVIKEFTDDHLNKITNIIKINNGNLMTISEDGSAIVYIDNDKVLQKINFDNNRVQLRSIVELEDRRIIIGGTDNSLRILI